MAMVASSPTSVNPNINNSSYEIFISHRGPDVKNTFASYLYHRLFSHGLKVFLDRHELQQGDYIPYQIERAIETASVHVAIFSPRYAESTWCLEELLLMLKSKAPIIPVFYHVKPAELRWTQGKTGLYAQALQELKEKTTYDPETQQQRPRYESATVEKWRTALSSVSQISGFELETCNGDEGMLLEKVVLTVLRNVKKTPLNVAKYPTGLDEKLIDFENQVLSRHQQSGRSCQVIGIVGLGGVGKTTLAKKIFNGKRAYYKNSCFLSDVRERVGKGSLTSLQSILLKELSRSTLQIDNKDEGMEKLKMDLLFSEILLVLDDVDKVDHLDALLPDQISLHPNSLILITSRNKDVLTRSGVGESSIYKLDGLSEQHSLELFCYHAFSQPHPLPGFEVLTQKFLKACHGLPLSLKVLGALLLGNNDMSYWHEQLGKLENILPNEIQERLKISYDTLEREEKQIFLDIACFLIGHDKDTALRIWDASGWKGRLGFQNLQNKCLVEVERDIWDQIDQINMHDHIRDLGRDVARSLLPCRLWRWTENVTHELLQQSYNGQVITVRGIRMGLSEFHDDGEFDSIQMRRLQLVETEGFLLERILRRVNFPDLIWLCWNECPHASLPSWIPMKNLRVLQVSGSKLETLCSQESQLLVCLEELRLHGCHQLKSTRGLEQATKLQRLDIRGCSELEALPSMETLVSLKELWAQECVKLKNIRGLEQATKLQRLDVSWCSELEALPSMETLQSLEELWLRGCVKLKSIWGLEQATNLRRLNVSWCSELEALPSMETLVSLEELWAEGCMKIKSILGLELATKLRLLNVDGCLELEALPRMETLVSLEELCAEGCVSLNNIRGLEQATRLKRLHVGGCSNVEALQSMETLVSLQDLWIEGCVELRTILGFEQETEQWLHIVELSSIRGLERATQLRRLHVGGCPELEALPNMETLVSLEWFSAQRCVKLNSIQGLEKAIKLRWLNFNGCSELEALPSMETLVSLEGLWAEGCVKLKSIRGLEQATKLQRLDVSQCSELEALPSMETLQSLEELRAPGCVKLKSIRGLQQATKLRVLDVSRCFELEALPRTSQCLEELRARECVKLKSIRGLEQATKLQRLDVSQCSELEALHSMETLQSLEELSAEGCVKLKSIRGLEQATKLRLLDVSQCFELEELPSMETSQSLEQLQAPECVKLKSIRGLEQATKLRLLDVSQCSELEALPSMETLQSLEELRSPGCVKLKSIRGLEQATKLQRLDVSQCSELEALPSMEKLQSLEELLAWGCVKVKSIPGLEQATKLQRLDVSQCFELESLPSMETLQSLEELRAQGCVKLKSIQGLEQATRLRRLDVSRCSELEALPSTETLQSLEELQAWGCVKLNSIPQSFNGGQCSDLESLQSFDGSQCSELWAWDA